MLVRKSQLNLVSPDNPILHKVPALYDFEEHKDTTEMFANLMFDRMKELQGMGLSANQVGLDVQMFTMGFDLLRIDVFNPKIIETFGPEESYDEGCLSYPGIQLKVRRPVTAHVEYFNVKGDKVNIKITGLTARIFLHEYDHMMGKTFKEHVSKLKWDMANKRLTKIRQKLKTKYQQKFIQDTLKEMQEKANEAQ